MVEPRGERCYSAKKVAYQTEPEESPPNAPAVGPRAKGGPKSDLVPFYGT